MVVSVTLGFMLNAFVRQKLCVCVCVTNSFKPELICLHPIKLLQVLLCNSNNLISVICL